MDFVYAVKQLKHEIDVLESQLSEKKDAAKKLMTLLSPQEKTLLENALDDEKRPPGQR